VGGPGDPSRLVAPALARGSLGAPFDGPCWVVSGLMAGDLWWCTRPSHISRGISHGGGPRSTRQHHGGQALPRRSVDRAAAAPGPHPEPFLSLTFQLTYPLPPQPTPHTTQGPDAIYKDPNGALAHQADKAHHRAIAGSREASAVCRASKTATKAAAARETDEAEIEADEPGPWLETWAKPGPSGTRGRCPRPQGVDRWAGLAVQAVGIHTRLGRWVRDGRGGVVRRSYWVGAVAPSICFLFGFFFILTICDLRFAHPGTCLTEATSYSVASYAPFHQLR
jgi:hypothetical protein